jgi:hypothetical protein
MELKKCLSFAILWIVTSSLQLAPLCEAVSSEASPGSIEIATQTIANLFFSLYLRSHSQFSLSFFYYFLSLFLDKFLMKLEHGIGKNGSRNLAFLFLPLERARMNTLCCCYAWMLMWKSHVSCCEEMITVLFKFEL